MKLQIKLFILKILKRVLQVQLVSDLKKDLEKISTVPVLERCILSSGIVGSSITVAWSHLYL